MATVEVSAIIERENDGFDIAGKGASIEEARSNLTQALALFLETASPSEVARRSHNEVFVTQVEVPVS